jgi:hypothetical protein
MTPFMSISGLGGPQPSFARGAGAGEATFSLKYHMNGENIGTWRMYWSDGDYGTGTLTPLEFNAPSDGGDVYFLTGEKQTSDTQAWRSATVNLSQFWGTSGRLVFLYLKTSTGWKGDIAWDAQLLTINGVSTTYTASNKWRCTDPGQTYSSLTNSMAAWTAGSSGTETTISTASSTRPLVLDLGGRTASNNAGTGPSDGDGGGAYLYIETSNHATVNMYNSSRYCWSYTTEITLA